ncbi:N-acetyl-gamma-glutamyl-phosphate reductase [Feifania hominis]|uniref:N-acetyl-gamma-glutamyl-phosphate reductase n=1 Tax=Feifania hominis TaxID=2763660 RepID=A0A926DET3_9FIRM|nr:N-acetyl-gamma-glutamyl-phosphate reductase [Feifania hominis]MBC8536881.1 N-acetyl-gamma-glutamyl-phosphate reductase [Feifania hominis]
MIKAGIIGATGYAGVEILRILQSHPEVQIAAISSVSFEEQGIDTVYPNLYGIEERKLTHSDEVIAGSDVVFGSLPAGVSEEFAQKCVDRGAVFIDMGADFRLDDEAVYAKWYKQAYKRPELHEKAVYGLTEWNRAEIAKAPVIGNPGCFPTSVALGLWPALMGGLVKTGSIVIDSKSGVTGAGRGLTQNTHYAELNEGFAPYKIGAHRHTPEIEQTLSKMAGTQVQVVFTPHLLPINRGILSTMYLKFADGATLARAHAAYEDFYRKEPFVRVLRAGDIANVKNVRYSNYCDISLHEDAHTGTLIVVAAIDNMVKGAAGQAIQNMNVRFGLPETMGLTMVPPAF